MANHLKTFLGSQFIIGLCLCLILSVIGACNCNSLFVMKTFVLETSICRFIRDLKINRKAKMNVCGFDGNGRKIWFCGTARRDKSTKENFLIAHSHRCLENLLRGPFWRGIRYQPVFREGNINADDDAEDCGEPRWILENYAHSHAEAQVETVACESDILISFFVC